MRKLLNTSECTLKGYFTGDLKNESTKDLEIQIKLNSLIEEYSLDDLHDCQKIVEYLTQNIPASYFSLSHERELNIKTMASSLYIAIGILRDRYEIVKKTVHTSAVLPSGRKIKKEFNFLLKDNSGIEPCYYFVNISKGKQKATKSISAKGSIADFKHYVQNITAEEYARVNKLDGNIYIMDIALTPKDNAWSFNSEVRCVCFKRDLIAKGDKRIAEYEQLLKDSDIELTNENVSPNVGCQGCTFCTYKVLCDYLVAKRFSKNELVPAKQEVSKSKELKLTDNQRTLVDFDKGIARVLASAGSGKTTTLAGIRTCNLIDYYGYNPDDFLFLTFSERGVREVKEKINYWAGYFDIKINDSDFNIFTFNGFGQKIIEDNYRRLGFEKMPKLILRSEKRDLITNCLEKVQMIPHLNYMKPDLEMFNAKGAIPMVEEYIDWLTKNNGSNKPYLEIMQELRNNQKGAIKLDKDEDITPIHEAIYKVFKLYNQAKKDAGYIEFDDQIKYCLDILSKPEFAEKYARKHLIVDEFQDSDELQLRIIQRLIDTPQFLSFVACGDDSQSIFGWRGASSDNIINFDSYFENYGDIYDIELTDNFRCNGDITALSNNLNDKNSTKYNKVVKAYKVGDGNSIEFDFEVRDKNIAVIEKINKLQKAGYGLEDIAVIARTNGELTSVASCLEENNIPYNLVVVQKLIDIPEVRGMLSFGKYLYYPDNYLYLSEFYQIALGSPIIDRPLEEMLETEEIFKEKLDEMDDAEIIDYFYTLVEGQKDVNNGTKTFHKLLSEQKFEDVNELAAWLNAFIDYNETLPVDKDLTSYEAITLMTAHSSKGSEFKAVITLLDKFDATKDTVGVDEERRSLFVAITRAKDKLFVISGDAPRRSCKKFEQELQECL